MSPLPTPESLDAAIERDALRLSTSIDEADHRIHLRAQPIAEYADWYAALQNAYGRWGPPSYQTLYAVFESGTLPGASRG